MTLSVAPMPHDGSYARAVRGGKFCSLYFLEWDLLLGATCDVKRATDPDSIDDEGGDSIFFLFYFVLQTLSFVTVLRASVGGDCMLSFESRLVVAFGLGMYS